MGHWVSGVVELAADGDHEAVTRALENDEPELKTAEFHDNMLRFCGMASGPRYVEDVIESIETHLERAVIVFEWDGGGGNTDGQYYESVDGELRLVEAIEKQSGRRSQDHYDYFAAKYDIHAAV